MKHIKQNFDINDTAGKITLIFLYLLPIIDMLNSFLKGYMSYLGILLKGIFLLYVIGSMLLQKNKLIISLTVLISLSLMVVSYPSFSSIIIFNNIVGAFKFYFFIVIAIWIVDINNKHSLIESKNIFKIWFLLITMAFIISYLTNTYNRTYPWMFSTKAWYYAGNEISSLLMGLFPVIFILNVNRENVLYTLYSSILMILISVYMGTKTIFFGYLMFLIIYVVISLIYFLFCIYKKGNREFDYFKFIFASLSIIFMILLYFSSPVYKQIEDHNNIIKTDITQPENLEVEDGNMGEFETTHTYYPDIFKEYPKLDYLNMILKNRLVRVVDNGVYLVDSLPESLFFGVGSSVQSKDTLVDIQTEMDFFTVFIRYGIFALLLILYMIVAVMKMSIHNFKITKLSNYYLVCLYSFILLMGAAFLAGHILIAPLVNVIIPILIVGLKEEN